MDTGLDNGLRHYALVDRWLDRAQDCTKGQYEYSAPSCIIKGIREGNTMKWETNTDEGWEGIVQADGKHTVAMTTPAPLIAAAPEMYDALVSVLASVPFASYRGDGELEECEQRVRAALQKAELSPQPRRQENTWTGGMERSAHIGKCRRRLDPG